MTRSTLLRLLPLAALTGLLACTESDKDEDEDEDETSSDLPAEGAWTAGEATVVTNGCEIDGFGEDDTGDPGDDTTTITVTGDDSFTVTGDDLDLTCTRDGAEWDCGEQVETEDFSADGADAVLTQRFSFRVALSSSEAGDLTATFALSCEGTDCGLISEQAEIPLPCESVLRFPIAHAG